MFEPNAFDSAEKGRCIATFVGGLALMVAAAPLVCWSLDAVFRLIP